MDVYEFKGDEDDYTEFAEKHKSKLANPSALDKCTDDSPKTNVLEKLGSLQCAIIGDHNGDSAISHSSAEAEEEEDPSRIMLEEAFDVVPRGHGTMCDRSPSASSDLAEDDAELDGASSDHCIGEWEMDDCDAVVVYPHHLLYKNMCYTDSELTFSSSYIEIKCSDEGLDTLNIQWAVDDILEINFHWVERVSMAIVCIFVLPKDSVQAEDVSISSGIELKFAVTDTHWYEKEIAVTSLNLKYKALWSSTHDTDADAEEVSNTKYFPIFDEPFEEVVYPKGDSDAVCISKRDVDLLQPATFVNDTIIDFYIKYLKNKIRPEETRRFHFFNSFFFRKLADPDKESPNASEGKAAFQRVRKWTRKVNLFEKDFVFIPVNFGLHWSLLVMCHLGEVATFQDDDVENAMKVPCILHLDSMKGTHSGLKGLMQSYLWEEWKEKQKNDSEDICSRFRNLKFVSLELPQQANSFDCGLFLLHYVELFLEQAPVNLNPFMVTKCSKFLSTDWFEPSEASLKRGVIQKLIYDLLKNRSHGTSPTSGNDENCAFSSHISSTDKATAEMVLPVHCNPSSSRNLSSSEADQGIEVSLLPSSSLKGPQFSGDAGLAFGDLLGPGLMDSSQFSPFNQNADFDGFKSSEMPIEEEVEVGRHGPYPPSTLHGFHNLAGTSQLFPASYSAELLPFGATWNSEICGPEIDNNDMEMSASGSDCSVEEVNPNVEEIEQRISSTPWDNGFAEDPNKSIQVESDLNLRGEMDQPDPLISRTDYLLGKVDENTQVDVDNNLEADNNLELKGIKVKSPTLTKMCIEPVEILDGNAPDGRGSLNPSGLQNIACPVTEDSSMLEPEVQHAFKKMRFTVVGEEGPQDCPSKYLHL